MSNASHVTAPCPCCFHPTCAVQRPPSQSQLSLSAEWLRGLNISGRCLALALSGRTGSKSRSGPFVEAADIEVYESKNNHRLDSETCLPYVEPVESYQFNRNHSLHEQISAISD